MLLKKILPQWHQLWRRHSAFSISGQASERERRIAFAAMAGALAKAFSIGSALVSVPLTLHYLGPERFGMWMTISSLVAFLTFADLGVGNGLLSSVATAHGRDDCNRIAALISSAYAVLSALAIFVLALFAISYNFVPWHRLFNVQSELARAEAGPAVTAIVACFALGIPLGVVQRTQIGLQMSYVASLWQCAGSLVGLACIVFAVWYEASLPLLIIAFAGAPLLAGLANSLIFFGWHRRDLAPQACKVSQTATRDLMGTGLLFLVLQLAGTVTFLSDNLIITQKLGAMAVPDYAVPEKLFALIGVVIALALAPLWPAYGEAIARGDGDWVQQTLRRSLLLSTAIAAMGSVVLVLAAPLILTLWVGHTVAPPVALLVGLGVWKVLEVAGISLGMFLNGAGVVGLQVFISIVTAAVAVLMKFTLIDLIGISGTVWATIVTYSILALLPYYLLRKKLIITAKGRQSDMGERLKKVALNIKRLTENVVE